MHPSLATPEELEDAKLAEEISDLRVQAAIDRADAEYGGALNHALAEYKSDWDAGPLAPKIIGGVLIAVSAAVIACVSGGCAAVAAGATKGADWISQKGADLVSRGSQAVARVEGVIEGPLSERAWNRIAGVQQAIAQGANKGSQYLNSNGLLPSSDTYMRYTVGGTPIADGARLVIGGSGAQYYSPDHYTTFFKIAGS